MITISTGRELIYEEMEAGMKGIGEMTKRMGKEDSFTQTVMYMKGSESKIKLTVKGRTHI